jgi:uroporphyrinogen-III synthase
LTRALAAGGANVCVVEAYRTVCGEGGVDLPRLLAEKRVDVITFTSSSTVECFLERFRSEGGHTAHLSAVLVACIGPKTAATAQAHHLNVAIMPETYTLDAMLDALEQHFLKLTHGI